jgi:Zn-dependent peptidase ImmA (M78 family)/transcriptional regulator with XRE-family HTH domain
MPDVTQPNPLEPGSPASIAAAARQARERAGLSQDEVAQAMGWKAGETVSALERGDRQVKAFEVAKLANLFRVGIEVLLGLQPVPAPALVLWRTSAGQPHANANRRMQREAALVDRAARYKLIVEWANERPTRDLLRIPHDPTQASTAFAHGIAEQVSEQLNLGNRPARALLRTLEETYGVSVFYESLGHDADGSAACAIGEFGVAVLLSRDEPPWRRNFSLAHELFHLVTWHSVRPLWERDADQDVPQWYNKLEAQANAFASALLLPTGEVLECVRSRARDGRLTAGDLASLAVEFGVSLEALAIRLKTLGVITEEDKVRARTEQGFQTVWRKATEGHWTTPELPFTDHFVGLVRSAYQRGEIGRAKAAQCLEVPLGELPRFGFDEQYDDSAALTVA